MADGVRGTQAAARGRRAGFWAMTAVMTVVLAATVGWTVQSAPAQAEPFPPGAGVVDVRDHGAVGDGVADDTAALQRAIDASLPAPGAPWWEARPVYLPAGTYRLTAGLERRDEAGVYTSGLVLIGESRDATVLKLDDHAPGFDSAGAPRAVIFTSSGLLDTAPNKDHPGLGEGNDAYANFIEDLTIDVGAGNPGAIAVDYLANNLGAIRNVRLVAAPGSGHIALALERKWPGPALLSRIEIEGFHIGLELAQTEYGVTLERVSMSGQRRAGIRNRGNVVSGERVEIRDVDGPALINADARGLIALRESTLDRRGSGPAIMNAGVMTLRDVTAGGEQRDGVWKRARRVGDIAFALPTPLPPEAATPETPEQWADVVAFGAKGDGVTDDTAAIQAALDSGAASVLFPHGRYVIAKALIVPETVALIEGVFSSLTVSEARDPAFERSQGMLTLAPRAEDAPLTIRRLGFDMTDKGDQVGVLPAGPGALALSDIANMGVTLVDRPADAGPVFAENVCCSFFRFAGQAGVWMRHLNTEGGRIRIVNQGAPLSILGLKTEQHGLIVETRGGGVTEIFGGFIYGVERFSEDRTAFHVARGRLVATYAEEVFDWRAAWPTHVAYDTPDGLKRVKPSHLPRRGPLPGRMPGQLVLDVEQDGVTLDVY